MRPPLLLALLTGPVLLQVCAPLRAQAQHRAVVPDPDTLTAPVQLANRSRRPGTVEVTLTAGPARHRR